jgi:hypothetical protein
VNIVIDVHFGGRFCQVSSRSCDFTSSLKWSKVDGPVPLHPSVCWSDYRAPLPRTASSVLGLHVGYLVDLAVCFVHGFVESGTANELIDESAIERCSAVVTSRTFATAQACVGGQLDAPRKLCLSCTYLEQREPGCHGCRSHQPGGDYSVRVAQVGCDGGGEMVEPRPSTSEGNRGTGSRPACSIARRPCQP